MASAWALAQRAFAASGGKMLTDGKRTYFNRETIQKRLKELEAYSREKESKRRAREARQQRAAEESKKQRNGAAAPTPAAVDGEPTRDVASPSVSEAG